MNMQNVNSIDAFTGRQQTAGKKTASQGSDFMDILNRSMQGRQTKKTQERSGGKRPDQMAGREADKAEKTFKKNARKDDKKDAVNTQEGKDYLRTQDSVAEAENAGAILEESQYQTEDPADGQAETQLMAGQAAEAVEEAMSKAAVNVPIAEEGMPEAAAAVKGEQSADKMPVQTGHTDTLEEMLQAESVSTQSAGAVWNGQQTGAEPMAQGMDAAGQRTGSEGLTADRKASGTTGQAAIQNAVKAGGQAAGDGQEASGLNGSGSQGEESLRDQAEVMKQMAAGSTKTVPEASEKTGKTASAEELQKYVDEQIFVNPGELAARSLSGTYEAGGTKQEEVPQPVPEQLKTGLEQGISKNLDTFTIRLKPEGLGEILIHMERAGGRIAMSIGVTNAETQKMLTSEMMNLKEMLKPMNAEVKEIYQSQTENFDMMTYQQGFFQQNRNLFYAGNSQRIRHFESTEEGIQEMTDETGLPGMSHQTAYTAGGLNAYV